MKLDLRKDYQTLKKHLAQRVRDYPKYINGGPGEDEDNISLITFGYQFDQAGWAAIVFDTRPDAEMDGSWQSYIEENEFEMPHWFDTSEQLYEDDEESDEVIEERVLANIAKLSKAKKIAYWIGELDKFAAVALCNLFDVRPWAELGDSDNKLKNAELYM